MARLVAHCPACEGDLQVTRLACKACETQLEGQFDLPPLLQLSPEDLAFVTTFVRTSGSLKAVAEQTGTSYPTVRNRLNEILAQLAKAESGVEKRRHAILDALEQGKMSAKKAAAELKKVGL
ncbi:MAG TPA: DUF2089 domain-containing protein [Polyangiaceae bacterium]|nr:DUF2089 domain-containing protein [Polyangiaceae bacterium]